MRRLLMLAIFLALTHCAWASELYSSCPGGLQDKGSNVPAITFGGSGIPTNAVCFETFGYLQLGLSATQRFDNPPLGNDGLASFFALQGGDSAHGQPGYGQWNFDLFAHNGGGSPVTLTLFWDTDPGVGTDEANLGFITQVLGPGATIQDSWNLGFGFITAGVSIPGVYAPSATPFNPNALGQYTFALRNEGTGDYIAMNVYVTPEPSTGTLGGLGLVFVFALWFGLRGRTTRALRTRRN